MAFKTIGDYQYFVCGHCGAQAPTNKFKDVNGFVGQIHPYVTKVGGRVCLDKLSTCIDVSTLMTFPAGRVRGYAAIVN